MSVSVSVFETTYADLPAVDVYVEHRWSGDRAARLADRYAFQLGQLPTVLRRGVSSLGVLDGAHMRVAGYADGGGVFYASHWPEEDAFQYDKG